MIKEKNMKHNKISKELEYIDISQLKGIRVLYENDFYELAKLVIKIKNAHDKIKGNVISRPTINGLAKIYHNIIGYDYDMDSDRILQIIKKNGIKE